MTDQIIEAGDTVHQLVSSKGVQAMIAIIVTIALMAMLLLEKPIPDWTLYAWFALLGLYMELPGKAIT